MMRGLAPKALRAVAGGSRADASNSRPLPLTLRPQTTFPNIGGYTVVAAGVSNTTYTFNKTLQIMWTGAKYAATDDVDLTVANCHYIQNGVVTRLSPKILA
jgi:hypothetical protein